MLLFNLLYSIFIVTFHLASVVLLLGLLLLAQRLALLVGRVLGAGHRHALFSVVLFNLLLHGLLGRPILLLHLVIVLFELAVLGVVHALRRVEC